jgi:hypothetical protein
MNNYYAIRKAKEEKKFFHSVFFLFYLKSILKLFIYSHFSSELDKDFTHEFNNLRQNKIKIELLPS